MRRTIARYLNAAFVQTLRNRPNQTEMWGNVGFGMMHVDMNVVTSEYSQANLNVLSNGFCLSKRYVFSKHRVGLANQLLCENRWFGVVDVLLWSET